VSGKVVAAHFFHFSVDKLASPLQGLHIHVGLGVVEGFVEHTYRKRAIAVQCEVETEPIMRVSGWTDIHLGSRKPTLIDLCTISSLNQKFGEKYANIAAYKTN
jgi:pheromone shutdown protein TraB